MNKSVHSKRHTTHSSKAKRYGKNYRRQNGWSLLVDEMEATTWVITKLLMWIFKWHTTEEIPDHHRPQLLRQHQLKCAT